MKPNLGNEMETRLCATAKAGNEDGSWLGHSLDTADAGQWTKYK